jgi:hypothetical protein
MEPTGLTEVTELKVKAFCGRTATDREFEAIWKRAKEIAAAYESSQRPPTPMILIHYEDIPGWFQCINDNDDPPRRMGPHYKTQEEAEAYRDGWYDGWAND